LDYSLLIVVWEEREEEMFKKGILLIGLFGVLLPGAIFVFASGICMHISAASPVATKVTRFSPSGIRGSLDMAADCWETSLAASRADAWRCIVVNTIYDPCFSTNGQKDYVICDAKPDGDERGLKVRLAHALPEREFRHVTQAWMMRLVDGTLCSFITGATGLVGKERINYGCSDGSEIVGMPKMESVWLVKEIKKGQSQAIVTAVREAWT
jgi:hypothetical protein